MRNQGSKYTALAVLVLFTFFLLALAFAELTTRRRHQEQWQRLLGAKETEAAQLQAAVASLDSQLKEAESKKKHCESLSDKARERAPRLYRRLAEATASIDEIYHGVCALYENEIIILTAAHGPRICEGKVGKTTGGSVRFAHYIEPLKHDGLNCDGVGWQEDAGYGFLNEQPIALEFASEQVTIVPGPDFDFAYIRGPSPKSLSKWCKPLRLAKSSTAAPFIFTLHPHPYEWHLPSKKGAVLKKGELLTPLFRGSPKSEERGNFSMHLLAILNGESGMGYINTDAEIVGVNASGCSDYRKKICTDMIKVESIRRFLKATWKKHKP